MFVAGRPLPSSGDWLSYLVSRSVILRDSSKLRWYPSGREALSAVGSFLGNHFPSCRIWIPAFLCKSAIPFSRQKKLELVPYDVSSTLEPVLDEKKIRGGDVLFLVRYFGLAVSSVEKWKAWFQCVVEDDAHVLPRSFPPREIEGDLAVYSLRKVMEVPDGAVLVCRSGEKCPPSGNVKVEVSVFRLSVLLLEGIASALGVSVLFVKDRVKREKGKRFLKAGTISSFTLHMLHRVDYRSEAMKRRRFYQFYLMAFEDFPGCQIPFRQLDARCVPNAFPILVNKPEGVVAALRRRGVEACRWPDKESWLDERRLRDFPGAYDWYRRLVLLPLHHKLLPAHLKYTAGRVRQFLSADED